VKSWLPMRGLTMVLTYATLILMVLVPLGSVAIWVFWDAWGHPALSPLLPDHDLLNIDAATKAAGAGIFLIGGLIEAYGLFSLHKTFSEASKGRPLSARSVNGFRRFAWVMLITVPVAFAEESVVVWLLSAADPTQPQFLHVGLGTDAVGDLFWGLMFVVVAEIFAEGRRASEENEAFL